MRKIINICVGSFLVFLILWTTGCESQYLGGNRNSKWVKDLNYLQKALPKKHANLFFRVSEEQFNDQINELKKSVDNLNDDEILDEIYKIVALIGDGHTKAQREFSRSYPFQFYYYKDSIYAINTIDEYKQALNCELIKINGQDIKTIANKLSPLISRENEVTIKKVLPNYLSRPEILHGAKIIEDIDSPINFTFKDRSGKIFDLKVDALDATIDNGKNFLISREYDETYPLYMQKSDLKYWYQYLEKDKMVYLKYNACSEDEKVGRLEDFNNEMLSFIQNNPVDKFVIDMRNNSGGGENRLDGIIEGIKNSNLNDKKRFLVIVGRQTFSAAIIDAVKWRNETNATFIGEPTSGKPNHYGAVKNFLLPNSNLKIQYSTTYAKTSNDERDSFIPDKTIELSIDDYVNKKDPVLDYIIGEN
ncbi:peptidase S41 [Clostridium sp. C2-6-12]|uniref:peptidase S41 n=1 Tax=Clostridium sp. C2-6-12 TaxID=2698832 RepID=UPI00137118A1|nr:peptidase S41 [Clostridium sp. C2-6-12]